MESFQYTVYYLRKTHTGAHCQCIYRQAHNPTINTSCGENAARLFLEVLLVEKLLVAQKGSCTATLRKAAFCFLHINESEILKKMLQAQTSMKKIYDTGIYFFCFSHLQFVTFDRTKIHLSLGKNFLLIQFESSTDLPSHCGWLFAGIQRIFLRKLSCQLLRRGDFRFKRRG